MLTTTEIRNQKDDNKYNFFIVWTFQWDVDRVILSNKVSTGQEFRCVCSAGPDHISNTITLHTVWTQTQMTDRINMPDVLLQRDD